LSRNYGAKASWNPKSLSRPVVEKLYLTNNIYIYIYIYSPPTVSDKYEVVVLPSVRQRESFKPNSYENFKKYTDHAHLEPCISTCAGENTYVMKLNPLNPLLYKCTGLH
jgi:hypothetical protein